LKYIPVSSGFQWLKILYLLQISAMEHSGHPPSDSRPTILSTRDLKFSSSYGAALMLPDGASKMDMKSYSAIQRYIYRNAKHWYQHINEVWDIDAPNGSLYIITGCDKCRSYELAAFYNPAHRQQELTFQFKNGASNVAGTLTYTTISDCSVGMRNSGGRNEKENLAVFLRGFRVAVCDNEVPQRQKEVVATSLADSSFASLKSSFPSCQNMGGMTLANEGSPSDSSSLGWGATDQCRDNHCFMA
jgi:hypothetical protein